jgi:hypothetical protein
VLSLVVNVASYLGIFVLGIPAAFSAKNLNIKLTAPGSSSPDGLHPSAQTLPNEGPPHAGPHPGRVSTPCP